ncbi:MAG: hypothetical protein LBM93_09965, partial [Oscillospiraceae bacterium]|jgi:hypothetical protein|nr:hypothetical protein [Oscillospiraceae bacterium]
LITQSPIANKDLTGLKNAGIIVLSIPAVTDINSLEALYGNLEKLFSFEEESDIPGLTALNNDLSQNDIDLGNFIYYLSDDFTAAGTDTFSGSFFDHFGKNLCGEISKPMPPEEANTEGTTDTEDTTGTDGTSETSDIVTPDTIILPAYLMDFTDNYLAENPSRVIILTEQSTSLLERPTDRIRLVIDELKAGFSDNTETGETVTDIADVTDTE